MVAAARQLHDARADTTLSYGALGTYYLGTTNATQLLISDNSVTLLGNPYGVFSAPTAYPWSRWYLSSLHFGPHMRTIKTTGLVMSKSRPRKRYV